MREVRWSLMALLAVSAGSALSCGSDDPLTGDAPDQSENMSPSTAGGGKGGKGDAGVGGSRTDGGKVSGSDAGSSGNVNAVNNCGTSRFSTGAVIPDMLIVLDRSGSMKPGNDSNNLRCDGTPDFLTALQCGLAGIDCTRAADMMTVNCGGTQTRGPVNRWDPSVNAINSLTAKFDSTVSFGLMTFPAEGNNNSCGAGGIKVPVGTGTSAEIQSVLSRMQPGGGTPTGETLQGALKYFNDTAPSSADNVVPTRYVLLVTDGQPTCPNSMGGSGGGNQANQRLEADKKLTLDALDALNAEGIKTYVVGYDAALDPKFATSLSEFAQHGGTGDYFPVQNEDSLSTAFESISKKVVTCGFEFKSNVTDPDYIRVTLDGKLLRPNEADGWVLEGKTITVQGGSCDILQGGDKGHRIEIVVECEPVLYI